MQQNEKRHWKALSWGTIVSIVFHVVIVAILLYQLPMPDFTQPEEETVSVEMVPPPPEEAEEPPQEEEAEEPPPAEEQQPEEEEQPPPPAQEQPQQQPLAEQAAAEIPIPVLRPVYEYGEQETGAAEADDGDAAANTAKPPEEAVEPQDKPIEPVETAETESEPTPEILTAMANADPADAIDPLPEVTTETPPEKADVVEPEPDTEEAATDMPEVRKLFSQETNDDPIARAAMGDLPRSQRIARLCSSELYAQLRNGSPSYNAELVPSFELPKGNELKVPKAAFRSKNRWYDISFRCEVDDEGMRIQSFGLNVGAEVPKSEWRKRGFPSS